MKRISFDHSIGTQEATDWDDFLTFMTSQLEYRHFVWRGQRDEAWSLEPTLDRVMRKSGNLGDTGEITAHLKRFKYAARGRRGVNPPELLSENDWWALGQHHGLHTPLLDWTRSPFVAAFFAYESPKTSSTGFRVVYGISQSTLEWKSQQIAKAHRGKSRPPILEFIEPLTDENPRLVHQGGLFTRAPAGVDIENWMKENFENKADKIRMWKILLQEVDRFTAFRSLNRMNINHLSLFPDLSGASDYVNIDLEIDKY